METTILIMMLLSVLPFLELRASIPYGIIQGINPIAVVLISVFLNILVIPFGFLFLEKIHFHLVRIRIYKKIMNKIFMKIQNKTKKIKTIEKTTLFFLTAIPLPGTGAYSGTLIAWLLGLKDKKTQSILALGVITAGIITTIITLSGVELFKLFF